MLLLLQLAFVLYLNSNLSMLCFVFGVTKKNLFVVVSSYMELYRFS